MFCQKCGKEINDDVKFCPFCGQEVNTNILSENTTKVVYVQNPDKYPKSQFIALFLCLFFGLLGIHDFYLERNGCAVAKLLITCFGGIFIIGLIINAIWIFIDFIAILSKGYEALWTEEERKKVGL